MPDGTMYDSYLEHFTSLFVDIFVLWIKSIYFILETIYLTILPNRFRKMKVQSKIFKLLKSYLD